MDRRNFLGLAAGAALASRLNFAAPKLDRVKLSITWGMLNKFPIADALAKTSELGFDGFEMFNWRDAKTLDTFATEAKKYPNLECATLVANKGVEAPGCGLVNPKERDQFLKEMASAVDAAKRVNCKKLVTLTGNEVPGVSREDQMASAIAGLKAVAPMLEKNGITAVVEILNTYVDHKGYYLYTVKDGARLIDAVGSPNVKILFDIYHVQIMEGFLIPNIRKNIDRIGHFHIGDVPGRHQPGTGEINYRNVFKAIWELGYEGYAALEYGPTVPVYEDMVNMRKMTRFS